MARKSKKGKLKVYRPESGDDCYCNHGWICEAHPDKPFEHDEECPGPGDRCANPLCTADPDSIFIVVHDCSINTHLN